MKIYLTGFMTSGKSTIGPILANVLGYDFYDLDKEIEESEKLSVVEIFEKYGEKYFREAESKILNELSKKDNLVISLGGGTIVNQKNFDMMKNSGTIIYLKVSPNTLYKRLKHKTDRPIFKDLVLNNKNEAEFIKRISELMEKRKQYYEMADIIIDTELTSFGKTVDRIAKKIFYLNNEKNKS
ncbi:shikimate kinase [Stygiobacter electus]|jgi:shikimate kinase|uniref:Shikimate kinase n=1 Tax=Stygiobacter electus TaxID=3032292 RepID=A0AAE3P2T5_9BACT|nr:shikimate kinase [Stygiobacter electus]MDF1612742.1 shikimate kinase [Stygiobacter electus]